MRRNAGFTLIELMTALALAGILAGIAVPSFNELLERQRASSAINALMAHMAQARMTAITYRRPAVLCPSSDGLSCVASTDWSGGWMVFLDRNGNRQRDDSDPVVRVDLQPTSRQLSVSSTRGRPQLRYLPDGRSAGTNLTLSLCNKRYELLGRVIVNNMGRPRSERPSTPVACPT